MPLLKEKKEESESKAKSWENIAMSNGWEKDNWILVKEKSLNQEQGELRTCVQLLWILTLTRHQFLYFLNEGLYYVYTAHFSIEYWVCITHIACLFSLQDFVTQEVMPEE